jgi:hypothetical protein
LENPYVEKFEFAKALFHEYSEVGTVDQGKIMEGAIASLREATWL